MLRACGLQEKDDWEILFPFVEFACNNSFQTTIQMVPYEALYRRKCRSPLYWVEVEEGKTYGVEILQEMTYQIQIISTRMKAPQDRQKSYVEHQRRNLKFKVGNWVYLKVSPMKRVFRFGKNGKLSSRYVEPYEILERVGVFAYKLDLPIEFQGIHNMFHISSLKMSFKG